MIKQKYGEECHQYFAETITKFGDKSIDWLARYGATRIEWKPFGEKTIADLLRGVVREINEQEFVPRRDQENLRGNKIRLRYYPFDPLLAADEDSRKLYEQIKRRGCLAIVDELSMLEPALRKSANAFLSDRTISVVTLSPLDPTPLPLEKTVSEDGPINLGNLLERFRDSLDPQCELVVSSRARLRRWLRQSVPETLGVFGGQADPDRRAEFLKLVSSGGGAQ